MAKTISFNFEGTDYTLEFTRATIERREKRGFVLAEIDEKQMTVIPRLFAGAFEAHHANVSDKVIERIFEKIGSRYDFIKYLMEMYQEPIEALMGEPEDEGKLEWKASW